MMLHTLRRLLALLILCASLSLLAWSLWPAEIQRRSLALAPGDMQFPEPGEGQVYSGTIPEQRRMTLEWPGRAWVGDVATMGMVFSMDEEATGNLPVESLSLYDSYSVRAVARLEMTGLSYTPAGETSEAMLPGRPVAFTWSLHADKAGVYPGSAWLYLSLTPQTGGPDERQVLTAQRIEIQAVEFLGLSGPWLRALSSAGLAVGMVFGLDGVAARLWRGLAGRDR
jgi:hypothetical protein